MTFGTLTDVLKEVRHEKFCLEKCFEEMEKTVDNRIKDEGRGEESGNVYFTWRLSGGVWAI